MWKIAVVVLVVWVGGVAWGATVPGTLGDGEKRMGDEIVLCGQYFHTGVPVVLWSDPGGHDATGMLPGPATRPTAAGVEVAGT